MIGIDTNVLVRYFQQDDPVQSAKANAFMESLSAEHPGYISLITLVETVWVLTRKFQMDRVAIAQLLESLLRVREVMVEHRNTVHGALTLFRNSKIGFSDCLIQQLGNVAGCEHTVTFDRDAAKSIGMRLLR